MQLPREGSSSLKNALPVQLKEKKQTNKQNQKKREENTADCNKIFKDKYQVCVDFLHDPRQIEELKPTRKKCKH